MERQLRPGLGLAIAEVVGEPDLLSGQDVVSAAGLVQGFQKWQHFSARLSEQRDRDCSFSGSLFEATQRFGNGLHLGGWTECLEIFQVQTKGGNRSTGGFRFIIDPVHGLGQLDACCSDGIDGRASDLGGNDQAA